MMINRRTFIVATVVSASTPFAKWLTSFLQQVRPDASYALHLSTPSVSRNVDCELFKIYGWAHCHNGGSPPLDGGALTSTDLKVTQEQLFIRFNQSWRTSWR